MTKDDSKFMLREISKLVLRNEKMKRNDRRKKNDKNINQSEGDRTLLPHFEPDFGVVRGKPYIFNCSVFGFDTILMSLGISKY